MLLKHTITEINDKEKNYLYKRFRAYYVLLLLLH